MSHIIFSITLVAKDVAHALELAAALEASGVQSSQVQTNIARTSAPASNVDKGEHELAYTETYGRTRITDNLIQICGLTGTREDMFAKFKSLRDSGHVIKTATGFALANAGNRGYSQSQSQDNDTPTDSNNSFADVNPDECV